MSFGSRLVHKLVIERAAEAAVDEYNQPTLTWSTLAEVRGLIQPKNARELAQLNEAGAVLSTHKVYLFPTDLREADRIRLEPDDGRRFEVTGVVDAAGLGHHFEVDARVVMA